MTRYAVLLTVAVLAAATVSLGVPGTATASTCSGSQGVTVVVDFNQLGGGVQTACDLGGTGRNADQQLRDVGHTLDYVKRELGFICRIDGSPSDDPCYNTPPGNAYWSLWWSDGKSGTWQYSSTSAGGLTVPAGGSVGMSWQGSTSKSPPSATPPRNAPTASPSPSPTRHPTSPSHPSSDPTHTTSSSSSASSTSGPTATATQGPGGRPQGSKGSKAHATKHPTKHPTSSGKASHGVDSTDAASPLAGVAAGGPGGSGGGSSGGLPGWVAPVAIVLLFLGSGVVVLARRRHGAGT